jgi:threonine/homoserine/homoserine lactone efflux protein
VNFFLDSRLLLSFCATAIVINVMPGPSVLFIVSRALAVGRTGAVAAAAGNSLGQVFQGVLAAFGVGAIIAESATVYSLLKYGGAVYLVWMGVSTLLNRQLSAAECETSETSHRRSELRRGFTVGATNPKTIIFFAAALPQFVDPARGYVVAQMLALLAIYGLMGWATDTSWGVAGGRFRTWTARSPRLIERLIGGGGVCIVALGASLALSGAAV